MWKDGGGHQEMMVPADHQSSQDSASSNSEGTTAAPLGMDTTTTTFPREEGNRWASGPEERGSSSFHESGRWCSPPWEREVP